MRVTLAVSAVAVIGTAAIYAARSRAPAPDAVAPRNGMARIAGAVFELGVPDPERFRSWCRDLGEPAETCDQVLRRAREQRGTTQVATFDLDRFEVTRGQLAGWLEALLARGDAVISNGRIMRASDQELLADFRQCDPLITVRGSRIEIAPGLERGAAACMTFAAAADYCRSRDAALPTLAQWQLAAAGREHRWLPWAGLTVSCADAVFGRDLGGRCGWQDPRAQSVDAIDQDVTPEGVHAMAGNVSEWVEHASATAPGSAAYFAAGGSWIGSPVELSTIKVLWLATPRPASTIGFRCATRTR